MNKKISNQNNNNKFALYNNVLYEKIEIKIECSDSVHDQSNTTTHFGFVIAGYCPCHVENLVEGGLASKAGLRKGDLIMKINQVSCCRARIKSLINLIKSTPAGEALSLSIYRLADSKSAKRRKNVNMSKNISNSIYFKQPSASVKPSKHSKLLYKLFRPSLWLSCAVQPFNVNLPTCINNSDATAIISDQSIYVKSVKPVVEEQHEKCMPLNDYIVCQRDCCKHENSSKPSLKSSRCDTGYETLSRYDSIEKNRQQPVSHKIDSDDDDSNDYTIETVTNTVNSYSECDLTVECKSKQEQIKQNNQQIRVEKFNEAKTKLIGDLIEMEASFVSYLSLAVSTFSRPLRGFFIKQSDYFTLFQNIEKILVISENFLRSMDKWSPMDLYTRIGQLYTQKINLFRDAFSIYIKGYSKASSLLDELKSHSKQFRLFLTEVETNQLSLQTFIALPIIHMKNTLELFKQIRVFTCESKRNPSEAPHIDSIIFELRKILTDVDLSNKNFNLITGLTNKYLNDEEEEDDEEQSTINPTEISSINDNMDKNNELSNSFWSSCSSSLYSSSSSNCCTSTASSSSSLNSQTYFTTNSNCFYKN